MAGEGAGEEEEVTLSRFRARLGAWGGLEVAGGGLRGGGRFCNFSGELDGGGVGLGTRVASVGLRKGEGGLKRL